VKSQPSFDVDFMPKKKRERNEDEEKEYYEGSMD
jgi:hypothetical protein